jgi:hypothetical protein
MLSRTFCFFKLRGGFMERVVNIVGMGASSADAPQDGENWGVNCTYKRCKKLDKLFFMDDFIQGYNGDGLPYLDPVIEPKDYLFANFLADNPNVELISRHPGSLDDPITKEKLKVIKEYPLKEAVKLIPGGYFTSTMAYMLCYAILEKVDRIRLYGFEVWSGSDANEYEHQAPCIDFWCAFALGRGIKIETPYYLLHTVKNKQNFYGYFKGELKK